MIELAVALDLADHGFGAYGETIFVNESPILDTAQSAVRMAYG